MHPRGLSLLTLFISTISLVNSIRVLHYTTLGPDPQTKNRLNGESYQQDALITFNGYQYAAFWVPSSNNASIRHATIARRPFNGDWESFVLSDHNQTEDDGHNTISIGISPGDGTIHMAFDQHDNPLNYRISKPGVALNPRSTVFSEDIFGQTTNFLPGLEDIDKSIHFINITYPRFLQIPKSCNREADLLLEMRVGRSGLGDDWLYHYTPGAEWTLVGKYLQGVQNNAYINGLDFDHDGLLHATWTYRDFINDTGKDVAVQAGPNGPENASNHDLNYAYSTDTGFTWHNNWPWGQKIADLEADSPILPVSAGIVVFGVPKYGLDLHRGILNQEAQTVDQRGRIHVLNRENTTDTEQWYHYWRSPSPRMDWHRSPLPQALAEQSINNITRTPTVIGKRGKLVAPPKSDILLALLPNNAVNSTGLSILGSTAKKNFSDWKILWEVEEGNRWEVLFDRYRLAAGDGILSLFVVNGTEVGVLDLNVGL